ncbi:MAG: aminotransferase class I/II-fold pyridoxal phosphate-dependent enzyme [Actinomycetota bacterium]|nr:aminotransferase class I/II-fold pyridoxal phosphate-dependent enzyme [Actinomycetota bacterium]
MTDLESLTRDQLRTRRTIKWNAAPDDVLAMWVAEMDYPTAPAVTDALHAAVDNETFGYPLNAQHSGLADVLTTFLQDRYAWTVDPRRVHLVGDVLHGVALAIELFSGPDDPVIITTPAYMPFFDVVPRTGRPQVHTPMTTVDGRPALDLEAIDRAFASGARTLVLCNPYNPLGLVLTRTELLALAQVVTRHGARVISDEIHAPLVLSGTHIPYASLSDETAAHTLTVVSASKAWNLPGLKCAQVITSNDSDTSAWQRLPLVATIGVSTLGIEATLAAYRRGGHWLGEVLELLDRHADLVADAVAAMPGVRHRRNEGTYLAWLDCTELELDVEPAAWFLERAKVMLSPGLPFRAEPRRFARLNFATTTAILEESLDRMSAAVHSL